MLKVIYKNTFEKDAERAKRHGKDLAKLKEIVRLLVGRIPLSLKNRDHRLVGNYAGHRECHIEPDWL